METVTIKDIAKALNLSTSTVSRALRGSYEISDDTKKLVLDYAKKVNYTPNPVALSLRENRSKSIGVIVPEIANNFFSNAINGIDAIAHERGYHVMIFQSYESAEREASNVRHAVARKLDGLIMSLSGETKSFELMEELQKNKFPLVFFDRVPNSFDCHKVEADNFDGAYKATAHLITSGRKRIAHVTSPPILSVTKERLAGYKAALLDHGLPYDENLVKYFDFDYTYCKERIAQLIQNEKPDAIFTASDRLALNAYSAMAALNMRIPEDIAFIGFTNLKVAHLLNPALTTVSQPAFELGKNAAEILLNQIESKDKTATLTFEKKMLPTELNIRKSSGVFKKEF